MLVLREKKGKEEKRNKGAWELKSVIYLSIPTSSPHQRGTSFYFRPLHRSRNCSSWTPKPPLRRSSIHPSHTNQHQLGRERDHHSHAPIICNRPSGCKNKIKNTPPGNNTPLQKPKEKKYRRERGKKKSRTAGEKRYSSTAGERESREVAWSNILEGLSCAFNATISLHAPTYLLPHSPELLIAFALISATGGGTQTRGS